METILKKSGVFRGAGVLIFCLFLLSLLPVNQAVAADSTAVATESSDTASAGVPSLENIKKAMAAGEEETKKIQEENRRQDIITWVAMILGFSLVIAIAWFTTSLAKKRRLKEDEIRAKRAAIMHQQHPHRKVRR